MIKNSKLVVSIIAIIGLTIMFLFQELTTPKTSLVDSKNNLMTAELFNQLVEIDYWEGNEKIVISHEEDITKIYNIFATLELSEVEEDTKNDKYGHTMIDFVTKDEKVGIGILSNEIVVDGEKYRVDEDILAEVRAIVFNE